jgi:hypothetical protein
VRRTGVDHVAAVNPAARHLRTDEAGKTQQLYRWINEAQLRDGHAHPHAGVGDRKSQHMARLHPPPTHAPLTAAITGNGAFCTAA